MTWFLAIGAILALAVWAPSMALTVNRAEAKARRPRLHGEGVGPAVLAVLLSAGALQQSPLVQWAGNYFIYGLIAGLTLTSLHAIVNMSGSRIQAVPVALVAMIAGLGWVNVADTDYGHSKLNNLGVTVIAVAAACLLLTNEARRIRFLQTVLLVAATTLAVSLLAPDTDVAAGRVAAQGATTIATGRIAGAGVVVLIAWIVMSRLRRPWLGVVGALALSVLMFETGSRGPLVAVAIAGGLAVAVTFAQRPARAALLAAAAVAIARLSWTQASAVSQERIALLFSDDRGASVSQREFMWSRSWGIATDSILTWRGWGNLNSSDLIVDRYPHNLFLEVVVEAGWLAIAFLLVLVIVGFSRTFRHRTYDASALPLLGLLAFVFVNAMVSGDVTDNRIVFVVAAACWTTAQASVVQSQADAFDSNLVDEDLGGRIISTNTPGAAQRTMVRTR